MLRRGACSGFYDFRIQGSRLGDKSLLKATGWSGEFLLDRRAIIPIRIRGGHAESVTGRRLTIRGIYRQIPADYRAVPYTEQTMQWNMSHHRRLLFPPLRAQEAFFWKHREGAGFCRGAALPLIDQSGCSRKNLQKFWKIRNLSGTDAATVQRAASSAMRQTRNSPKALAPNLATGQPSVWTANSGRHGNVL